MPRNHNANDTMKAIRCEVKAREKVGMFESHEALKQLGIA